MSDGATVTIQWSIGASSKVTTYHVGDNIFEDEILTGKIIAVEISRGDEKRTVKEGDT